MKLTTTDRLFLLRNHIALEEPAVDEKTAYERVLKRNFQLMGEQDELLGIQTRLIQQRDYWYRCCRRAIIFATLLSACVVIREFLF
jgi:hypothetical protein